MRKKTLKRICIGLFLGLSFQLSDVYAQQNDFANFARYAKPNAELAQTSKQEKRVVFMGNSITEGWVRTHPDFFTANSYIGRGISGQTSSQFLLRFREDVIKLSPALVVINAGTNDIAENTGSYVEDYTFGHIVSMVELAQANRIKVILTSVLPAEGFSWNKNIKDAMAKVQSLNARIKAYADGHHILYIDYFKEMVTADGKAMKPEYTKDGVHPTAEGYVVMEKVIKQAISKILK